MARNQRRSEAPSEMRLEPLDDRCRICQGKLWVAYHSTRTVATLEGLIRLRLVVRRCVDPECELYRRSCRPEEEGALALPQGEFGLDVIALVGALRHTEHRSQCPRDPPRALRTRCRRLRADSDQPARSL
jgi:hypothetical protein